MDRVDLFMPTCNRLEYTKVAVASLFETTNPKLVNQFIVVDCRSEDGTNQYLAQTFLQSTPFRCRLITIDTKHVVHAMTTARDAAQSTIIAKIDSDSVPCPKWLDISLDVMARHPELWALGITPRNPGTTLWTQEI
jgi:glycosyltransferase involved in cell wall biosynthesis